MNTITIDETITASQFICRAHRLSDGALVGEVITTSPTANLPCLSSDPVYVVVIPYQGERFQPNNSYAVNDLVFPADVITMPFYYQRQIAGTSGSTEPAWSTVAGGLCDDNGITAAWLCLDLAQPVIQAFITLTPEAWNGLLWDDGASIWDSTISHWTE